MKRQMIRGAVAFLEHYHIDMSKYEVSRVEVEEDDDWAGGVFFTSKVHGFRVVVDAVFERDTGEVLQGYIEFRAPEYKTAGAMERSAHEKRLAETYNLPPKQKGEGK